MTQKEWIELIGKLKAELDKNIYGQNPLKLRIILALLADGHVLLEGLPGLAKTALVAALQAAIIDCKKVRLQMTPDLMPADITGTPVYNPKEQRFDFKPGPIIGKNLALIDEINRATPKAQSALLEAMEERKVSVDGVDYPMEDLFLTLATMNPIEQEGTYPLPEAQQDRFCFKLIVDYGTRDDELKILENVHMHGRGRTSKIEPVISVAQLVELRTWILNPENVRVEKSAKEYIVDLVRTTRPNRPEFKKVEAQLKGKIKVGASPRAQIWLMRVAQVRAFLAGRTHVLPEDIKAVAPDVLRHRLILTDEVLFDGYTTDEAIKVVLNAVPVVEPKTGSK